ncbi:glycoside hydrolase family 16 protein [Ramaria rubella]|nr:glycoside hydrolase family 16 protein [Ramaria rubella]
MQLNGRDERYASASYSSISIPFSGSTGDDKDLALRPSQLLQGKVHKPWLEKRDWRVKASWWITVLTALAGVGASIAVCILGYRSVPMIESNLCPVLDDDFNTFDTVNTWHQEVDMSGYGNGEFEMTTNSPNNSYVKDGMLYILPTLTSDVIGVANVFDAFTYNVTGCTNTNSSNGCGAVSNATAGTVINPVMSARITTQFSVNITYGKVEIRAKLPKGYVLWPALWMLPVDNVYGPWPMSGEIDLVEARGNPTSYPFEPINWIRSTLNWGPTISLNRAFKTFGLWNNRRGNFGNEFHVYTMEWTDTFLRIYMDNRLEKTLDVRFNTPFFARGDFPAQVTNKTETIPLENPWAGRGNAAPFDQKFFLIMNVAVGGTNGWFPDNIGGKPWLDGSQTAMRDFALAQDQWYPTWPADPEDRAMVVDYVKMWQTC